MFRVKMDKNQPELEEVDFKKVLRGSKNKVQEFI